MRVVSTRVLNHAVLALVLAWAGAVRPALADSSARGAVEASGKQHTKARPARRCDDGETGKDCEPPSSRSDRIPIGGVAGVSGPTWEYGIGVAVEPRRWLELSLSMRFRTRKLRREVQGEEVEVEAFAFSYPVRARLWLRDDGPSPILDAGFGIVMASFDGSWSAEGQGVGYDRQGMGGFGQLAAGFGYRSIGPFRAALLVGAQLHKPALDTDAVSAAPLAPGNQARVEALDRAGDRYLGLRPFAELSLGVFF